MPAGSHTHRPVIVNGVEYSSIRDAAAALGVSASKVRKRVRAGAPGHAFVPGHSPEEKAAQRKVENDAREAYNAQRNAQRAAERARAREAKRERVAAERAAQRAAREAAKEAQRAARNAAKQAAKQRAKQLRANARQDEWWSVDRMPFNEPTGREVLAAQVAFPNVHAAAASLGVTEDEINQRIAQGQPGYVLLLDLYRNYVEPARRRQRGDDEVSDDEPTAPLPPLYGQSLRLYQSG